MIQFSTPETPWTAVDLTDRFGAIPLHRVVFDPAPGTATVEDVVRLDDHEDRLCELIDGTLVEKTEGLWESLLAVEILAVVQEYVKAANLGVVAGADGMMKLFPDQVRIPDASFISWERLKGSNWQDESAPLLAPDLAVEVISKGNTAKEMDRKLHEYFEVGTRLVWYVYPKQKTVDVYTSPDAKQTHCESDVLTGGEVLPGLVIELQKLFIIPAKE